MRDGRDSLVSVVVITYNSARTIIQTLDSIKKQSYSRIELIVTDDCSKDDTLPVCSSWLSENENGFERVRLITVDCNKGTCSNLNRGFRVSTGKWIKGIAGDDTLEENAIAEYVGFCEERHCEICYAKMNYWGDPKLCERIQGYYERVCEPLLRADYKTQRREIQKRLFVPAPGIFMSRRVYDEIGGYDERFMFADEWPTYYKIIMSGKRIYFLDKRLVDYRVGVGSLSHQEGVGVSPIVLHSTIRFYFTVVLWNDLKHGRLLWAWHQVIGNVIELVKLNKGKDSINVKITKSLRLLDLVAYWEKIVGILKLHKTVEE